MRNLLQNLLSDPVVVPGSPQPTPVAPMTEVPVIPENSGTEVLTDQTLEVMATAPIEDPSVEVNNEVLQLEAYLTGLEDYQSRCVGIASHLGQATKVSKQVMAGLESATVSLTEYYGLKKPKISKEGFMATAKEVGGKIRQIILELIKKIQEAFKAFFSKENFLLKKLEDLIHRCRQKNQEAEESGEIYYPFFLSVDGSPLEGTELTAKTMEFLENSTKILEALLKDCEDVTSEKLFKEIVARPDRESLIQLLTHVADICKDPLQRPELDWKTAGSGESYPNQTYIDLKLGGMRAYIPNYPSESSEEIAEALVAKKTESTQVDSSKPAKNKVVDFQGTCVFAETTGGKTLSANRDNYKQQDILEMLEALKEFLTSSPYKAIGKLAENAFHQAYTNYQHFDQHRKEDNNGAAIDKCYLVARSVILQPSIKLLNCMEQIENAMLALSTSFLLSPKN
jgi:hypothetical protein